MRTIGVDYDKRSKKYRARITRNGRVYHLGNFRRRKDAIKKRREEEAKFNRGERIDYIHSYSTQPTIVEVDCDPYLFYVAEQQVHIPDNPERTLRLAVLIQGIKDYLSDRAPTREDAQRWVTSEEEGDSGYTFVDIANLLALDVSALRAALLRASRSRKSARRAIGRRLVRIEPTL